MAFLEQNQALLIDLAGGLTRALSRQRIVGGHREQKRIVEQAQGLDLGGSGSGSASITTSSSPLSNSSISALVWVSRSSTAKSG